MSQTAEFTGEWIWGDEEETEVYAQGYGADATTIFRFSKNDRRTSLANRIVSCYFEDEDGKRGTGRGDESTAVAGWFFGEDDGEPDEADKQSSELVSDPHRGWKSVRLSLDRRLPANTLTRLRSTSVEPVDSWGEKFVTPVTPCASPSQSP